MHERVRRTRGSCSAQRRLGRRFAPRSRPSAPSPQNEPQSAHPAEMKSSRVG